MRMNEMNNRPATSRGGLAGVALIHAGLGYALVTGFDIGAVFSPSAAKPPIVVELMKPPPPAPATPPPMRDTVRLDAKAPVVDVQPLPVPPSPVPPSGLTLGGTDSWTPPAAGDIPTADPVPLPIPSAPAAERTGSRPRPGNVISEDDYPAVSRRLSEEGQVEVSFTVRADGRAASCAVVRSSGHPRLDAATCARIEARFRFEPAREDGRAVEETRTQKVVWALRG